MGAESELVLHNLAERSFLSLWSYPNPYTDNSAEKSGVGKELCDLLIIFSDKSCAYPNTGNESLDWKRWYKRAVSNSISQIYGAERWLKKFPQRIYSDVKCTKNLTPKIPNQDEIRVHRVVVALGAGDRCRSFFNGGSGSLIVNNFPAEVNEVREPFHLGNDGQLDKFVHVFDDVTLSILLTELDTALDFIKYLTKKENTFGRFKILATGEEDILGHYLATINENNEHDFINDNQGNFDGIFIEENSYTSIINLPQYQKAKEVNRPSYFWDSLIEHFIESWRLGNIVEGVSAESMESSLRLMASTDRLTRRILGTRLLAALETPLDNIRYMATADRNNPSLAFGFVIVPQKQNMTEQEYRAFRQAVMTVHGRSLRVRIPTINKALILGFNSRRDSNDKSEDMALMDFEAWSTELETETLNDMASLGIGANVEGYTTDEFPISEPKSIGGREALRRLKQMAKLKKRI